MSLKRDKIMNIRFISTRTHDTQLRKKDTDQGVRIVCIVYIIHIYFYTIYDRKYVGYYYTAEWVNTKI